jgi:ribosomal protein L21E
MDFLEIAQTTAQTPQAKLDVTLENFRKGDTIKIVRVLGGTHNQYKGYIGEIKDYKRGSSTALVILHAMNTPQLMRVPIEHLVLHSDPR